MRVQTIVYVTNMDRSITWYSQLLDTTPTFASEHWTTFEVGDAIIALHSTDEALDNGSIALSLVAPTPLEVSAARIGSDPTIVDQPFGRSFTSMDPDGARIQVNEHHR